MYFKVLVDEILKEDHVVIWHMSQVLKEHLHSNRTDILELHGCPSLWGRPTICRPHRREPCLVEYTRSTSKGEEVDLIFYQAEDQVDVRINMQKL